MLPLIFLKKPSRVDESAHSLYQAATQQYCVGGQALSIIKDLETDRSTIIRQHGLSYFN